MPGCIIRFLGNTYALQFEGRLNGVEPLEFIQQPRVDRGHSLISGSAAHNAATPAPGAAATASLWRLL